MLQKFHIELIIKNNKNIGKKGTFMMNSLNAKKKEKKSKGRKNKSFMHAFMHPHHIIPSRL